MVAVVADKTGYPADLLDLDLDLEADLGIDTVKQAEVFAQIRERFGIERDDKLKLRDYPTLAHVIAFVRDRIPDPDLAPAPAARSPPSPPRPCLPSRSRTSRPPIGCRGGCRLPPSARRSTAVRRPASTSLRGRGSSSGATAAASAQHWPRG